MSHARPGEDGGTPGGGAGLESRRTSPDDAPRQHILPCGPRGSVADGVAWPSRFTAACVSATNGTAPTTNTLTSGFGYTDSMNTAKLGAALCMMAFGVLLGAQEIQIETVSFGKEKPKNPGHDEGAWAENRRDDVVYSGE